MPQVSIINTTKDYITLRIPRAMVRGVFGDRDHLTETAALKILQAGMREHREGKTRTLISLRSLRTNGHRV